MPGFAIHQTAGNEFLVVVGNFEFVEKYNEKLLNLLKLHATGASLAGDFMSTAAARTDHKIKDIYTIYLPVKCHCPTFLDFSRPFIALFRKNVRRKTRTLF